jgi:hypothetical protein
MKRREGYKHKSHLGKYGHKITVCCPLKKCNYTSRVMFIESNMSNKLSNHSTLCPKHRLVLISKYVKEKSNNNLTK